MLNKNVCNNLKKQFSTSFSPKVSLIQRPGDSYRRTVTLIPGEGIGRELVSKKYKLIIN